MEVLKNHNEQKLVRLCKKGDEKAFGGWLKRIVINRCIDVSRKEKMVFADMETLRNQHLEIAEEVESNIAPELVHRLIKKLPNGARKILVLKALEGYKHAEIGAKLGISESTAKTQYFRAKQLLVQMLKENETEHREIFERATTKV